MQEAIHHSIAPFYLGGAVESSTLRLFFIFFKKRGKGRLPSQHIFAGGTLSLSFLGCLAYIKKKKNKQMQGCIAMQYTSIAPFYLGGAVESSTLRLFFLFKKRGAGFCCCTFFLKKKSSNRQATEPQDI